MEPLHLRVELARQLAIAVQRSGDDVPNLPGRDVGAHRHDPLVTGQHAFAREVVIATQQRQSTADPGEVLAIALQRAASLMPTMFGMLSRAARPSPAPCRSRAARHVVQHDRNRDCVGDRLVVPEQAFLCRPVVVRRDHQAAIGAGGRGSATARCFARRIRAAAGDDRHPWQRAVPLCARRRCAPRRSASAIRRSCRLPRCRWYRWRRGIPPAGPRPRNRPSRRPAWA